MPEHMPIETAELVGEEHPDVDQVIVLAHDGERTHVVTWGRTEEDCAMAAEGGNRIKKWFGWPDEKTQAESEAVRELKEENQRLRERLQEETGADGLR